MVLLTCSYKTQEFVRVGYYVNTEYSDQEMADNPPAKPVFEKVQLQYTYHNSQKFNFGGTELYY